MKTITFKTKLKRLHESDGTVSDIIDYKRVVGRVDCNLRPHEHAYYNSDLFPSMLNGAYNQAIEGKEWCRISRLPPAVAVDTSKFMAVVTVTLPESFK